MRTIRLGLTALVTALIVQAAVAFANEPKPIDCPLGEERLCLRHALNDLSLIAEMDAVNFEEGYFD